MKRQICYFRNCNLS